MLQLFLAHSWRYYKQHRILALLNIFGIGLGLTVFISIEIVNQSALSAFKSSVDIVAGRANLSIEAEGTRFDESYYPLVKTNKHILQATPVVEEFALLPDFPGQYLHILGIDPFSSRSLNVYEIQPQEGQGSLSFFSDPQSIGITQELAKRLNLKRGDSLALQTSQGRTELRVAALLKMDEAFGSTPELAVMDIANLQDRFLLTGKLNRIDCLVDPIWISNQRNLTLLKDELTQQLPGNIRVSESSRRGARVDKMIEAFQLNLTALSLIALVVGMFLIYNTMSATVVRRRTEIGLLRSIGLQAREVQILFLAESLLFAVLGILLGSFMGVFVAQYLVSSVSQTITSLYMVVQINDLVVSPTTLLLGAAAGFIAVLAAAWFPALEATKVKPIEALSLGHLAHKATLKTHQWSWGALLLLGCSALSGALSLTYGWKWLSFGTALFALLGISLFVPSLSKWIGHWPINYPVTLVLALKHFRSSLHRNSITAAALVTAVSMVLGISIMIYSFRITVDSWIGKTIQADLYVAPASNLVIGMGERIPPAVVEKVKQLSPEAELNVYREIRVHLEDQPVKITASNMSLIRKHHHFRLIAGTDIGMELPTDPQRVLVSESFFRQHGKGVNDLISFKTPGGPRNFLIQGVYEDFTSDRGLVFMDIQRYQAIWKDPEVNSLALYFSQPDNIPATQELLKQNLSAFGQYHVYSNKKIRDEAMRIFDQTFAVTHLLRFIALFVAGIGVFLSISILTSERQREIAILRATGASQAQVIKIVLWEAALIGFVSSLLGTIGGFVLALILSYVINISFFGWTIQWSTPWSAVLWTPVSVLAVAIAAAAYPAWQAGRLEIAQAVREE